ncbi:hypothetical protein [Infirmifilum sp. SLHALR2]
MTRTRYIALVVLVLVFATIVIAVVLYNYASSATRPVIPPRITKLNVTVVVLGFGKFAGVIAERLSGRVDKVIVYSGFNPEILRYAGRSTVLVLSDEWLAENAGREEVKEMIMLFADRGSMIYVNGTKAGVFQKMVYWMEYERGVESGMPPEALQELRERIESIPEESRAGIGYMKLSKKHDIFVFGSLEDALNTFSATSPAAV